MKEFYNRVTILGNIESAQQISDGTFNFILIVEDKDEGGLVITHRFTVMTKNDYVVNLPKGASLIVDGELQEPIKGECYIKARSIKLLAI